MRSCTSQQQSLPLTSTHNSLVFRLAITPISCGYHFLSTIILDCRMLLHSCVPCCADTNKPGSANSSETCCQGEANLPGVTPALSHLPLVYDYQHFTTPSVNHKHSQFRYLQASSISHTSDFLACGTGLTHHTGHRTPMIGSCHILSESSWATCRTILQLLSVTQTDKPGHTYSRNHDWDSRGSCISLFLVTAAADSWQLRLLLNMSSSALLVLRRLRQHCAELLDPRWGS